MGEEKKKAEEFRFLSDAEFLALPSNQRMAYLVKAGEELERRRQRLSVLAQVHVLKTQKGE